MQTPITKARFASIIPPAYVEAVSEMHPTAFGDYHLVLAHEVHQNPTMFRQVYSRSFLGSGRFVILDNSLVELGEAMSPVNLLGAYEIIDADCLVVPDVLEDVEGTLKAAYQFVQKVGEVAVRQVKVMLVIQGKNFLEIEECIQGYKRLGFEIGLNVILGIPRVACKHFGSRAPIIDWIRSEYGAVQTSMHLLGFSNNLLDDIACARMPGVIGIDSSRPWVYARNDDLLSLMDRQPLRSRQPSDWESLGVMSADQEALYVQNVTLVRDWINS